MTYLYDPMTKLWRDRRALLIAALLNVAISGCGSGSTPSTAIPPAQSLPPVSQPVSGDNLPVPDNRTVAEFRIALLGNSHVSYNDLAGLLKQLIATGRPQATVLTHTASGAGFLDERLQDNVTLPLLTQQSWTHVILQGQKYSTSGRYDYPIDAAVYWIALLKSRQTTPILFPEHATRGNATEGMRVYQLHQSIVQQQKACLTPVPQAWQASLTQWPEIPLHLQDGNHANLSGAVLTAMLFYQVITGNPADQLPYISGLGVSATVQQRLAQQASASLQQDPACPF